MRSDDPQSDSASSLAADPPARHLSTYVLMVCAQKMAFAHPDSHRDGSSLEGGFKKERTGRGVLCERVSRE